MDQDIEIINTQTRNEKIKNFFIKNKKFLISLAIIVLIILVSFFSYQSYILSEKENLAKKYNSTLINFSSGNKENVVSSMKEIVFAKDSTYSPLAFYFLLDNDLITDQQQINEYFDLIINDLKLEKSIKELNIFKKGLYNSEFAKENQLLDILNPIIKSESTWQSHAMYLMAEFYISKKQNQKAKEFFEQIVSSNYSNPKIKIESQKRLRVYFSE